MKYREASHKDKACPLTSFGMLCEGEVRYSSGAEQTKYTYTGQYSYTSDFGLMFYREASRAVFWRVDNARWYDTSLGRFTQADSVIPAGAQGLDRYAYVNNAPVNLTDPSGHMVSDGLIGEGAFSTNKNLTGFIRSRINNSIHTQRSLMIKRHAKTCQV